VNILAYPTQPVTQFLSGFYKQRFHQRQLGYIVFIISYSGGCKG